MKELQAPKYDRLTDHHLPTMWLLWSIGFMLVALLISGCATTIAKQSLPTVLTSRDQMWIIPANTPFKAIQSAKDEPKEFVVTDEDLVVVYKGNLQELEQEANRRVIATAKKEKTKGTIFGIIGSIIALLSSLGIKMTWSSIFGKKK